MRRALQRSRTNGGRAGAGERGELVHLADEIGNEQRRRFTIDLGRRTDLFDHAMVHHHDTVGHRQRFLLVMGHHDRCNAEFSLQLLDLMAQIDADLGIESRQRLIQQQQAGRSRNGAGQSNALLLAGLQSGQTMENGSTNFQGAYGQLISKLGTQTLSAQVTAEAQGALLLQAQESRDTLSGVNLDEEAADLIRFQQAYQAIAQVISVADSTFQTLLSAVGR